MNRDLLIEELKRDEGVELKAYQDTVGIWTIGIGRNLQDVGVSMAEAEFLLATDIDVAVRNCNVHLIGLKIYQTRDNACV